MNSYEFIIGLVLGAIAAFSAGFLKKAGEDVYSAIKGKIFPNKESKENNKISIELKSSSFEASVSENGLVISDKESFDRVSLVPVERISMIEPSQIRDEIKAAPPVQRQAVADRYKGLNVEWNCLYKSGDVTQEGIAELFLVVENDKSSNFIRCDVEFDKYRALGILKENARVRVSGEIEKVTDLSIKISNAHLSFFDKN